MRCAAILVLLVLSCAIFAADAKNKKKKNKKKPKPAPKPVPKPAPVPAPPHAPEKPPKGVCVSPRSDEMNKMLMAYLKNDQLNATFAKAFCMLARIAPMSAEYKDFFALKVITHRYGPHKPITPLTEYVDEFVKANVATIRKYNAITEQRDSDRQVLPFGCSWDLQNKWKQELKLTKGKRGGTIRKTYIVNWVEGVVNCLFLTREFINEIAYYLNLLAYPEKHPHNLNVFLEKLQKP